MNIRSFLGVVRRRPLHSFNTRRVLLRGLGPVVSFTFDDFPRTAYSVGGPILKAYGACGTYYVAPCLMNGSDELGELFHTPDVVSLSKDGHEIGTQTMNHLSARAVSARRFWDDVRNGRATVEQLLGANCPNFCYPYGHVTLGTKRVLGSLVLTSRSIIPGLNGPEVDLNLLRANRLYGNMSQAPMVEELIARNLQHRFWLIFHTHDVRPDHSEYGCTPELLEFAVATAAKSGSRIMTIGAVTAELGFAAYGPSPFGTVSPGGVPRPETSAIA